MQNGPRTNSRHQRSPSGDGRSKRWQPNGTHERPRGVQNAQRSYDRYIALAQAEAPNGDRVAAENYYQHAEHYFRSMSANPEAT